MTTTQEQTSEITSLLMDECGVGRRFASASLNNFNPTNDAAQEVLNACTQFVNEWEMIYENGSNLLMIGRPGTGKTHLAVAIMRGLMETYVETNVYMTTAQRIIRAMRDSWRQNSERTEYDVIGFYCEKDLLVIDEIGML